MKLPQRLGLDSMQHIRTCPGHTQHALYQAIHSAHVCTLAVWCHIYTTDFQVKITQSVMRGMNVEQEELSVWQDGCLLSYRLFDKIIFTGPYESSECYSCIILSMCGSLI